MKIVKLLLLLPFLVGGCQNRNKISFPQSAIVEFIGKEMYIPDNLNNKFSNVEKKILIYVGKEGCTECQLSLPQWKHKIRELRKIDKQVGIFFIVNTIDSVEVKSFFEKESLEAFLYFDKKNTFFVMNKIPKENNLHTFLLDNANRIVLMGSPINNEKMWNLYKEVFSEYNK